MLTCGEIKGGVAHNVIADQVFIRGIALLILTYLCSCSMCSTMYCVLCTVFVIFVSTDDELPLCVPCAGTCRSFRPNVQDTIERRMGEICCGCAMMNGANVDIDYKRMCVVCVPSVCILKGHVCVYIGNYPATVNAYPECVAIVNKASAAVVGADRAGKPQRTMGAEDFSYFLEKRPGNAMYYTSFPHVVVLGLVLGASSSCVVH